MRNKAKRKLYDHSRWKDMTPEARKRYNATRTQKRKSPEEKARIKAWNRRWYLANKEKALKDGKEWKRKNPDKYRDAALRRKFGITLNQFTKLFEQQGGGCAICGSPISSGKGTVMRVDHEHSTGKVRGLLCQNCNCGLGHFKDSTSLLQSAITYLQK